MSKKKQPKQRKKRKNETKKKGKGTKMATLQNLSQGNQKPLTVEDKINQLNVNLMQIDQQKGQIQQQYAQSFANLFSNIATEFFKSGKENPVEAAIAATEAIREGSHKYVDQLKEAAPMDPRLDQAVDEIKAELATLEAILASEEDEEKVVDIKVSVDEGSTEEAAAKPAPVSTEETPTIVASSPSKLSKEE